MQTLTNLQGNGKGAGDCQRLPYLLRFGLLGVEEEDGSGDGGGPATVFVTDGGLGDISGANDLVGDAVDLLLLVPALVGVEVDVESGGEHLGGEFFGIVASLIFGLAEAVVFGEVAVGVAIGRNGDADAGDDQTVGFTRGVFRDYSEDNFTRIEVF